MTRPHTITAMNRPARRAFTLVELMVVIVIIGILSSLTLSGLAGVRQRAREDKTKSTIRKIDAVIRPMYDSYRTRRVPVSPAIPPRDAALDKLRRLRQLMVFEMPDSWSDVPASFDHFRALDSSLKTSAVRAYTFTKAMASPSELYGSAECLHMILSTGGFEPDALELFRPDEIGDIDKDGVPEFWDGWGRPIAFFRWAPGYSSPLSILQSSDFVESHDPFDPWNLDPTGFSMIPLIVSAGPDNSTNDPIANPEAGYGLARLGMGPSPSPWSAKSYDRISDVLNEIGTLVGAPDPSYPSAHLDNITNHDLSSQ